MTIDPSFLSSHPLQLGFFFAPECYVFFFDPGCGLVHQQFQQCQAISYHPHYNTIRTCHSTHVVAPQLSVVLAAVESPLLYGVPNEKSVEHR